MIIVIAIIIAFACYAYTIYINKILLEKEYQSKKELEYQKEITIQCLRVQELERKRIAESLHDDIGSRLNVLSLWINNEDTWSNERSRAIIAKQIPSLIASTRSISHSLYPKHLEELGLVLMIEDFIGEVDNSLKVRLNLRYKYRSRPFSFEIQLYRILQEFLSNVIKHAQASCVEITIRDFESSLLLLFTDNGIGMDQNTISKGMGIKNIETRVKMAKGVLKWKSEKSKGTRLIIAFRNNEKENTHCTC